MIQSALPAFLEECRIREANETLTLREDQLDAVLKDLHEITADQELVRLSIKWKDRFYATGNASGDLPVGDLYIPDRAPLLPLISLLSGFDELKRAYANYGIPDEVLRDTLSDVCRKMDWCMARNGRYAMEKELYVWLAKHFAAQLYHLGRLQFEAIRFQEDNAFLSKGDWVLNTHIPSGGNFTHDTILDSYRRGVTLFRKLMPDVEWKGFVCESWLLSPQLRGMLDRSSNMIRFLDDYRLYGEADDEGFYTYVFSRKPDDLHALDETTALQRAIKAHLLAGGKVLSGRGFLAIESVYAPEAPNVAGRL